MSVSVAPGELRGEVTDGLGDLDEGLAHGSPQLGIVSLSTSTEFNPVVGEATGDIEQLLGIHSRTLSGVTR